MKNSIFCAIVAVLFLVCASVKADSKYFYSQRIFDEPKQQRRELNPLGQTGSLDTNEPFVKTAGVFIQKLDHFDDRDSRTFSQRYFFNDMYARGGDAPVILYICGESSCAQSRLDNQVRNHAQKLGAYLVTLEHRYYGRSQPFEDHTTENLKFLSTDQALQDLANFQNWYSQTKEPTGKWITVGGSYAGNLSAFYRAKFPEKVVGALASSAPVYAKERFEDYDAHVRKVAGEKCSSDMLDVFSLIEAAVGNSSEMNRLKNLFSANEIEGDLDFLYAVTDVSAAAVQYGMKREFCESIGQGASSEGKLRNYAEFAQTLVRRWQIKLFDLSFESAISTELPKSGKFGMRAWLYQSCTEYGYWQVAHESRSFSARSKLIDLDFHRQTCKKLFDLDAPAPVEKFNENHYLKLLEPEATNIFYTNGDTDPWSTLSILDSMELSTDASSVYIIEGAAHCDDLRSNRFNDSQSLKQSREAFLQLARQWLR